MKKYIVIMLVISLFIFTNIALADSHEGTFMDKIRFTGGLSYNTFAVKFTEDDEDATDSAIESEVAEAIRSGMGFFVGGIYPLNDKMSIEVGYDSAGAQYTGELYIEESVADGKLKNRISGFYGGVDYKINKNMSIKGLLTSYNLLGEAKHDTDDTYATAWEGNGIGALVGGEYKYMMEDGMDLVINLAYRYAVLDLTKYHDETIPSDIDVNFDGSGIRLGVGINIAF